MYELLKSGLVEWFKTFKHIIIALVVIDLIIVVGGYFSLWFNDSINNYECSAVETYSANLFQIAYVISVTGLVFFLGMTLFVTFVGTLKYGYDVSGESKLVTDLGKRIQPRASHIKTQLTALTVRVGKWVLAQAWLMRVFDLIIKLCNKIKFKHFENFILLLVGCIVVFMFGVLAKNIYILLFTQLC